MNTFQQSINPMGSIENVEAAEPPPVTSEVRAEERPKKSREPRPEKKLSPKYFYEEIHVQINKIRDGDRHTRMNVYISLKTDTDMTFSTFLTGSITTAIYETRSMAESKKEYSIVDKIDKAKTMYDNNLMTGRFKYKPLNGYKTDMHKGLIPHVLLIVYIDDEDFNCILHLLDETIPIKLTRNIEGKQKEFYDLIGTFKRETKVMSEEDAFE
jgi:hypothetical protein